MTLPTLPCRICAGCGCPLPVDSRSVYCGSNCRRRGAVREISVTGETYRRLRAEADSRGVSIRRVVEHALAGILFTEPRPVALPHHSTPTDNEAPRRPGQVAFVSEEQP